MRIDEFCRIFDGDLRAGTLVEVERKLIEEQLAVERLAQSERT